MSASDARSFVKELMKDESLRGELNDRLDLTEDHNFDEEVVREGMAEVVPDLAAEHGYDFTAEEGFEAFDVLRNELGGEELSDTELEQVAGGSDKGHDVAVSIFSAGIACAVSSAQQGREGKECM